MSRIRVPFALLMLMLVGAVMAACGGTTTVKTAADGTVAAADEPQPTEGGSDTGGEAPAEPAKIGSTLILNGFDGLQMQVTLLALKKNVKSTNEFIEPEAGNRFVAVQLQLENVSDVAYNDSPSNGAAIVDTDAQGFTSNFMDVAEPALGSPTIAPGKKRVGWITFEVPKNAKLDYFQFTLDSGFADETGEWRLVK